jgi:CRISPR/Cas system CSM-associated protein Csm3 (group 7 of RAMP superfamily)
MTLEYNLTFLSDWHCGSGLAGGAEADAVVIKDDHNLPYVSGKTIKGLIREAMLDIQEANPAIISEEDIKSILETSDLAPSAYFSNAELPLAEQNEIAGELSHFLYRNIASTQIEKNGTAKGGSLRVQEVTMPLTLVGKITGIQSEEHAHKLKMALQWVRCLGVNRNRGLGRCKFEVIKTML